MIMKIKHLGHLYLNGCAALAIFFSAGCDQRAKSPVAKLPHFSIRNEFAGGELRQVIDITNGVSHYFDPTNVVVWFGNGADIVVGIDPKLLKPSSILFEIPASSKQPRQSVLDINADGIPDVREIKDESGTQQVFYRGQWYTKEVHGSHPFITIDGKKQRVHFDGQQWIDVSANSDKGDD